MTLQTVKEGNVAINIHRAHEATKNQEVFYNPDMEGNRTLTLRVLETLDKTGLTVTLPLAGSGVRALRLLKELPSNMITSIAANDLKEEAVSLMKKNIRKNDIDKKRLTIQNKDANTFLQDKKGFDFIDLDPFGSPNIALQEAILHTKTGGLLAVTATDTGALAGAYPQACKQKYWAVSTPVPQQHELGLRILIRKVIMIGMHYTKRLNPIFAYHHKHYYRIFFRVKKGKAQAASQFSHINTYFQHCSRCGFHQQTRDITSDCPECGNELSLTGPLYDGPLQDQTLLSGMQEVMRKREDDAELQSIVQRAEEEARVQTVGFFDTHQLAKTGRHRLEKVSTLIRKLQEKRFTAVRSSEKGEGIKTDAPFRVIREFLR